MRQQQLCTIEHVGKKNPADEYINTPLEWDSVHFFKAGAIKSEAVAFTNGIRDHPFLLSIVNECFNDVDEKNSLLKFRTDLVIACTKACLLAHSTIHVSLIFMIIHCNICHVVFLVHVYA